MSESNKIPLERLDETCWRIPPDARPGMRVPGLIFADEEIMEAVHRDQALEQVANVACLPGIQYASLAMPDIHWGYGFCIGGVCATDPAEGGVISPGGVGYDINCGVRLVRTDLFEEDVKPQQKRLIDALYTHVPTGVGLSGRYKFNDRELDEILTEGPRALKSRGLADDDDLEATESRGRLEGADPGCVSARARDRGRDQCGTLGGGNHFLEVQIVDRIEDEAAARAMGLDIGTVCAMIHSGSRGLGHQVCDETIRELRKAAAKYGYDLPDRQLACAPVESPEGERYLGAMRAAGNFAWANRQILMALTREAFERVFRKSWEALGVRLVYDVAHNIAKSEEYEIDGKRKAVCVHRKGATRAFPPGHPETPEAYREMGQPVLIPGDMGRASWVLAGLPGSMEKTFGTSCHGAGRALSRKAARKAAEGRSIADELLKKGIVARARTQKGLSEEQSAAYKSVDKVVDVVHRAGISRKIARLRPIGVIKG